MRYNASRPQRFLNPRPLFIVACDDSKTAPMYFEKLQRKLKGKCVLKVVPEPRGGGHVLELAAMELRRSTSRNDTTAWALIDLEGAHDSKGRASKLRDEARKLEVRLLLSQPCF